MPINFPYKQIKEGNQFTFGSPSLINIYIFAPKSQYVVKMKEIGLKIKQRRQQLKVTQQELADLSMVGINTLVAIERGQGNSRISTLMPILDVLGLKLEIKLKD